MVCEKQKTVLWVHKVFKALFFVFIIWFVYRTFVVLSIFDCQTDI